MTNSQTFIQVQQQAFDIGQLSEQIRAQDASSGALVTFTGVVRELTDLEQELEGLYLEHYPGMTEQALATIVEKARARWQLGHIAVVHRVGVLTLNENIVFVGVASAHRYNAFQAACFIMDYLKRDAPFWKKEITNQSQYWVEQKDKDIKAAKKW